MRHDRSFTILELLIVVIIVGILAGVAVPMMSKYIDNAKKEEARAGVRYIRTRVLAHLAEYPFDEGNFFIAQFNGTHAWSDIGINPSDLDGKYFSNEDYAVAPYGSYITNETYTMVICRFGSAFTAIGVSVETGEVPENLTGGWGDFPIYP